MYSPVSETPMGKLGQSQLEDYLHTWKFFINFCHSETMPQKIFFFKVVYYTSQLAVDRVTTE